MAQAERLPPGRLYSPHADALTAVRPAWAQDSQHPALTSPDSAGTAAGPVTVTRHVYGGVGHPHTTDAPYWRGCLSDSTVTPAHQGLHSEVNDKNNRKNFSTFEKWNSRKPLGEAQ